MSYSPLKMKYLNTISYLLFFIIFVFPSPIITYYFIPGSYLSILASILCVILLTKRNNTIHYSILFISIILIIYSIVISISTQNVTIISLMLGLPLCLIIYSLCQQNILFITNKICDISTPFFILGTLCIIISLIYTYVGGTEIFTIENPDGRLAKFYISSLSNSQLGNIIRPSFIYDEAGAYSFYLTILALLRVYLNKNKWITLFLLYGSLVTFSLTHLIICILFTIKTLNFKQLIIFSFPIAIILSSLITSFSDDISFFINRLSYDSVQENNRTTQLINFKQAITRNDSILLVGNIDCFNRADGRCIEDGDISSSPVTPLYRLGLLGISIQFSFFIISIWNFRKENCIFIAVILNLILLQRPFFTAIYYSFSIFLLIFCLYYPKKNHSH